MSAQFGAFPKTNKIMLVGFDQNRILEKRFKAAGYQVLTVDDNLAAIEHARHDSLETAVLVSRGSLVNIAETAFNLRDLNQSMEIIILVNRVGQHCSRFLRQILEHPIERTRVLTRRQLQRELHTFPRMYPRNMPR